MDKETSEDVSSVAARLNPMTQVEFIRHVLTPEGFREAKSCVASALAQAKTVEPE